MPNLKENYCDRKVFEAAIKIFEVLAPDNRFALEHIYLDYGAGMMWETIVCYRGGRQSDSYQVLNPRDWDNMNMMTLPDDIFDLTQLVISIAKDQSKLLGINLTEVKLWER